MKRTKITLGLCFLLIMSIFLSGCPSRHYLSNYPGAQPNTKWSTKDGSVAFSVDPDVTFPMHGYIKDAGELLEIVVCIGALDAGVGFFYPEDWENYNEKKPEGFASGWGTVVSKKEFQIEIYRADALFESGQRLTFYRIDRTGDDSLS